MYLFMGGNGSVVAISPADGREVWRTSLLPAKFFTLRPTVYEVTVLNHEAQVFALNGSRLYTLDAASGDILWSVDLPWSRRWRGGVSLTVAGHSWQPGIDYWTWTWTIAVIILIFWFH